MVFTIIHPSLENVLRVSPKGRCTLKTDMTEFKLAEVSFRLWTTMPLLCVSTRPTSFLPGLPSTNIELGYHKSIITTGYKNQSAEIIFIPFVNAWLFIMAQYQSSGFPGHHRVLGRFPPPKESNTSERGKV